VNRSHISILCLALIVGPSLLAQGVASPPAQQNAQPPKSTALITGRVVDGTTGQPIPEAVVTLIPPGGRAGGMPAMAGATPEIQQALAAAAAAAAGGRGNPQQRVMTGGDGRFVYHDLPPGQFQLSATLTGYTSDLGITMSPSLPGIMGGISPSTSSTTLALKEGEFATGVTLRLWKFAVLTGTLVDDGGEPAIGLTVQVARKVTAGGRVRYVPAWSARTDDRGAYRISSIVPGEYLVVVPQAQVSMPSAIMSGILDGVKNGNMANGGTMVAMMDLMSSGVLPTDSMTGGVRIGDYMVASSGSVPLIGPDGHLLAYQTIFYPGVSVPAQASVIKLGSGEEKTDVNFQLRLIATSRVSGVATGPDGPVANLGVRLVVPADGLVSESEFDVATAITKADGSFAFYGVPPGQFLLKAQKQPRPEIPAEALAGNPAAAMFGPGGIAGSKAMLFASLPIAVANGDLDGLSVRLQSGYRAAGHIEFQSATGRGAPVPQQMQAIFITLNPVDGRMPNIMALASQDKPDAQANFQTKGYEPGRYFLSVQASGLWTPKSATVGGRDILDNPLELRDADVTGISIVMTDKVGQVTGTVRAPGETDLSETSVFLFPVAYRNWADNGMNPRQSRTVRASRNGVFTMPRVPPGEYFIIAVDRSAAVDLQDPARLDDVSRAASRVTVTDETATVSLQKVKVGR